MFSMDSTTHPNIFGISFNLLKLLLFTKGKCVNPSPHKSDKGSFEVLENGAPCLTWGYIPTMKGS